MRVWAPATRDHRQTLTTSETDAPLLENGVASLAPVFFEFRGGFQLDGIDCDDLQFRTTGRTVDDFTDLDVIVQCHVATAFRTGCHSIRDVGAVPYQTVEIRSANRLLWSDYHYRDMGLPLDPLLVAIGLVLATTGVFIYRKALYGFGGLAGAAGGLLAGTSASAEPIVLVGAAFVGSILGIWLVLTGYRLAILAAGGVSGFAVGLYATGGSITKPMTLVDPVIAAGVIVGVVAGWFLRKVIVIGVSAAWGASLVSIALAPPIEDVTNVTEVVDALVSPWLYGVFVVGLAVQIGLYSYLHYYKDDDGEATSGLAGRLR